MSKPSGSGGNEAISKLTSSFFSNKDPQSRNTAPGPVGAGPSSSLQQRDLDKFLASDPALSINSQQQFGVMGGAGPSAAFQSPQRLPLELHLQHNPPDARWISDFHHHHHPKNINANAGGADFEQYQTGVPVSASVQDWHQEFQTTGSSSGTAAAMPVHQPLIRRPPVMFNHLQQPTFMRMADPYLIHEQQEQRLDNKGVSHSQMNEMEWNREFENRQKELVQVKDRETLLAVDDGDALAKTAGVLADIIQESSNPKFQNSKFLSMMQQFRDKEIAIEGDKIIQQIPSAPTAAPMTNINITHARQQVDHQNLYQQQDSFIHEDPGPSTRFTTEQNKIPSSFELAQEFLTANGQDSIKNWEEDFMAKELNDGNPSLTQYYKPVSAPPRNYNNSSLLQDSTERGQDKIELSGDGFVQQFSSDVSHDMDWSGEFRSRLGHLDGDSVRERALYEADTKAADPTTTAMASDFQEKLNLQESAEGDQKLPDEMTPEQAKEQWRNWERMYELQTGDISSSTHNDTQVSPYGFVSGNPFLDAPVALLSGSFQEKSSNITESILCLEAVVQRDPQNSAAWLDLGRKQQENENESAAIAALQKALELDQNNLDAYLAIAVSYTNENLTSQAQKALSSWIQRNPKYSKVISIGDNIQPLSTSSEVHEILVESYLQAATYSAQRDDVDADVQQALGVLFNIANDYPKAIDCFQTAVSCRPNDFQLWNRLGATFANSGEGEKAMDSYFQAIQINPLYIRARYNLAIACMQLGQYNEAAGYLLSALSIQEQSLKQVIAKSTSDLAPEMRNLHNGQSESVWNGLKMLVSSYIRRDDLSEACDARDLNAFKDEFDF